jgi:hypothetical protein
VKRAVWIIVLLFPLALFAVACGGGGDDNGSDSAPADANGADGNDTTGNGSNGDAEDSKEPSSNAMKGSPGERCPAIFSLDEVAALFGEEAVFEEDESSENESLGQLHCVWSSVEDPDDTEDFQVHLLQVQVYSGDPIDGANFYSKDIYDGAEDVEGVGDKAFQVISGGVSMAFVDGKLSAFLDYSVIGPGESVPAPEKAGEVAELFRKLHDRVTN